MVPIFTLLFYPSLFVFGFFFFHGNRKSGHQGYWSAWWEFLCVRLRRKDHAFALDNSTPAAKPANTKEDF